MPCNRHTKGNLIPVVIGRLVSQPAIPPGFRLYNEYRVIVV